MILFFTFAASLFLALTVTPLVRRLALAINIVDQPDARKLHTNPIPLLGGVAMYAAFVIALFFFGGPQYVQQILGILLSATFVALIGMWDDWRPLPPYVKLGAQILATVILILGDVKIEFLHNPVLNILLTIFWVVGITNAFNLLDNMDGLSGGTAAVAAIFFMFLAATQGQVLVGILAAALVGASIGFLIYNFNPASIFMGDAGSLFLGLMLAAVGIKLRFPAQSDTITWMIPIFVLGVPIFDTTLVSLSRLRRGKNPLTTPGKDHLSHRLVKLGLSVRQAVLAIYALGIVCGGIAYSVQLMNFVTASITFAIVVVIGLAALAWFIRRENISTGESEKPPPSNL